MGRVDLSEQIKLAFSSVALGDGVGIYEAEAIDNYAGKEEIAAAKAKDREVWGEWTQIPDNVLGTFYSALCFVDPEGMRFLLPAYMLFAINNYKESDSASIDSVIYALDRGSEAFGGNESLLSSEQKSAIISFLKYMVLEAGEDWVDATVASRAYEQHWSRYEEKA